MYEDDNESSNNFKIFCALLPFNILSTGIILGILFIISVIINNGIIQ